MNVPVYSYEVVNTFPHDPAAYTEGLFYHGGLMYESTGKYGKSSLRKSVIETGTILKKLELASTDYAEGIAILNNKVYQLTYSQGICFVYDLQSFALERTLGYEGQGWGLTTDGELLIMSNGTEKLYFRDPETFECVREVSVTGSDSQPFLNALAYVGGKVYANDWPSPFIDVIDPGSGELNARIDLTGLGPSSGDPQDVLNGTAYDQENDRLFVTGKRWPNLYQIRVLESSLSGDKPGRSYDDNGPRPRRPSPRSSMPIRYARPLRGGQANRRSSNCHW